MKYLLTIITLAIMYYAKGQEFTLNDKSNLETSIKTFRDGLINGRVKVRDIHFPDENFECLKSLGEPTDKWERHSRAGDEYKFTYDGVTLGYHNTNDAKMTLAYIEIIAGTGFLLIESDQVQKELKVTSKLDSFIKSDSKGRLNLGGNKKTILTFPDADSSKVIFETSEGEIRKIRMWL